MLNAALTTTSAVFPAEDLAIGVSAHTGKSSARQTSGHVILTPTGRRDGRGGWRQRHGVGVGFCSEGNRQEMMVFTMMTMIMLVLMMIMRRRRRNSELSTRLSYLPGVKPEFSLWCFPCCQPFCLLSPSSPPPPPTPHTHHHHHHPPSSYSHPLFPPLPSPCQTSWKRRTFHTTP